MLKDEIRAYIPFNEQEIKDKEEILRWLEAGGDEIYTRKNRTAHMTASAWVVSPDRRHVLMAYHNLYQSWAWLGGHADGETDLRAVARREAEEESGIAGLRDAGGILSLEILTVDGHEKRGEYVSSHLHLNVTYLFEAEMDAALAVKPDENSAVGWIAVEEMEKKVSEPWMMKRVYRKLIEKAERA